MFPKHTPGEWWTSGLEVGTAPMMIIKIAKVSGSNYEQALANAKLIAATPKLLESLQTLIDAIPNQTNDQDWWPDELTMAVNDAKSIIKKATE